MTNYNARDEIIMNHLRTADEMAAKLRVDKSWILTKARCGAIPSIRVGKYVRFDESAVMDCLKQKIKIK